MHLGENVRAARVERKLTVAALAQASGLSKGFVSQVEGGKSSPSLASLGRIALSLDMTVAELVGGERPLSAQESAPVVQPRLIRRRPHDASKPSLTFVASGPQGRVFIATLPEGASLEGLPSLSSGESAPIIGLVTGGSLLLKQGETELAAQSGDVLTWDAGRDYRLLNWGRAVATIYITLPPECALPALARAPRLLLPEREAVQAESGPFKLVALRAQRSVARRR